MERVKVGLLAVIAACLLSGVVSDRRIDLVTRADAQAPGAGPSVRCLASNMVIGMLCMSR